MILTFFLEFALRKKVMQSWTLLMKAYYEEQYTERKNLIESKRTRPMRYLIAANEKIYLTQ